MDYDYQKRRDVSDILLRLASNLDLPPSKLVEVEEKYRAVTEWLGAENCVLSPYDPDIYPHGSFRLGTVVAPIGSDEFDLDFVCRLNIGSFAEQRTVKLLVGSRLRENGRYKDILIEKNRCWRLNYAGSFHMDIMPAIPDLEISGDAVLVSDKDLERWMTSNPAGFAKWFDEVMIPIRKSIRIESRASVEELPDSKIKTPLQQAIQLMKRHRDLRFAGDPKWRPSSIIITTLAAKAYRQEDTLYAAMLTIVSLMEAQIEYEGGKPVVRNPANPGENLAEKWIQHPNRFEKFKAWLKDLRLDLASMLRSESLPDLSDRLIPKFGDRLVNRAIKEYGENLGKLKTLGCLGAGSGPYVISPRPLEPARPNNFYGS